MTETLNTIRTIDISELADGPITVEALRTVLRAAYSERLSAGDFSNAVCNLVDGETLYCISEDFLDALQGYGWFLNRLPLLARPAVLLHILVHLHDKLESPDEKASFSPHP